MPCWICRLSLPGLCARVVRRSRCCRRWLHTVPSRCVQTAREGQAPDPHNMQWLGHILYSISCSYSRPCDIWLPLPHQDQPPNTPAPHLLVNAQVSEPIWASHAHMYRPDLADDTKLSCGMQQPLTILWLCCAVLQYAWRVGLAGIVTSVPKVCGYMMCCGLT